MGDSFWPCNEETATIHFDDAGKAMLKWRGEDFVRAGPRAAVLDLRWSEDSHHLCPRATRLHAVALLSLGYQLAKERAKEQPASLVDVWRTSVLPRAMSDH